MSWIPVEFSLVRYSAIEGTHFFFDPNYPTAVQFLLNGAWESWDVSYVRYKAQDPEIRRIAEAAEAQLIHDEASGYRPWPHSPPSNGPGKSAHEIGHAVSPNFDTRDAPFQSGEPSALATQTHVYDHAQRLPLTSPPPHAPGHPSNAPYASPYQPALPSLNANPPSNATTPIPSAQGPYSAPSQGSLMQSLPSMSQLDASSRFDPYLDAPASPKSPLPLPATRDTKVLLSLDGDGVRGLSTILLVESLVNAICSKMGRRADPFQIFDLMGGTSSGGVLAVMLGRLRMRAHKAREAYVQIARAMFMDKWNFFVSLDPHAQRQEHDPEALDNRIKEIITHEEESLEAPFFDARHDSTNVFVISTQVDIGINRPALIRTYPTRRMAGPELDANITTWQAMRATCIAPRYQSRETQSRRSVIEPGLVDYGTGKNNPIKDLVFECRKLYGYAHDTMVVVSIGTGSGMDTENEISEMAYRVRERAHEAQLAGEKFELDNEALIGRGWMKYFRFNVPDLDDVPLDEWSHVERIKEKTHAYLGNPEVGQKFYACVDAITGIVLGEKHVPYAFPG